MIDVLKKNIDTEIEMLREIANYTRREEIAVGNEKQQLSATIQSLQTSIKLLNDAIPDLLDAVPTQNKLVTTKTNTNLEQITFKRKDSEIKVSLQSKDKEKFLRELSISESLVQKLKRRESKDQEKYEEFKAARGYLKMSNRFFQTTALNYIKKGYFKTLYLDIKKANLDMLFETYVSMMFFTSFLSIFVGIFLSIFLLFFSLGIDLPFITAYTGSYMIRLLEVFWIPFVLPFVVFFILYFYPSTEKNSIAKRIENELPFAVIHMSAISGSGIPPSEIFKIIGLSKEYPFLRKEIRKVLNQTNIYGYDLVTALGNTAQNTPSQKLAELFNGISTTINSGGDLSNFFEKRAETLLAGYRLEREKFTHTAETFMDIYISVVIATPMILLLLLVMISLTGIDTGFSPNGLALLIIVLVAFVNILFLGFLQIKQPTY